MKTIMGVLMIAAILLSGAAVTDYTISSGTYANGDMPFDDIPFIQYNISIPSDWTAEQSGYWENEVYYTFHKDDTTSLYAGESYRKDYMDATTLTRTDSITMLEFGDYTVPLVVTEAIDSVRYRFFIPVGESYCCITGLTPEYSKEQQDEFFEIVKTFEIAE
jgi:hypothetical protein